MLANVNMTYGKVIKALASQKPAGPSRDLAREDAWVNTAQSFAKKFPVDRVDFIVLYRNRKRG